MRILLLGNTGQLGWELERSLACLGWVLAVDYPTVNMADPTSIVPFLHEHKPQVIVNATAYTAVDQAEKEADLAYAVNGTAPGWLAQQARQMGAGLIHYSTDYVFDGTKGSPYAESDLPNPLNIYGKSKLAGEQAVEQTGGAYLILRTSWVYSLRRDSFVTKVLRWSRQRKHLSLVTDQISNPTWARMLAEITAQTLAQVYEDTYARLAKRSGLYHLAGRGYCSRKEWGEAILHLDPNKQEQVLQEVLPALSADFPNQARRPMFSALDCTRFEYVFGLQLPKWDEALRLAMAND